MFLKSLITVVDIISSSIYCSYNICIELFFWYISDIIDSVSASIPVIDSVSGINPSNPV